MNTQLNTILASLLIVLLVGCAPISNAAPVVMTQSPIATPSVSNAAPLVGQSPVATPSGKVRTNSPAIMTMVAAGNTQLPKDMFFQTALAGNKLFGAGQLASGKVALFAVDLNTNYVRQFGTFNDGVSNIHASNRYVVWNRSENDVLVYDLQADKETVIATGARYPDISDNIVVWTDWRNVHQPNSLDIYGYDLTSKKEIPIITRLGVQSYPRISGQWIVYLDTFGDDTADVYARNLSTREDFKIGTMPMLGQRIGTVEWYPVISGNNVVWVSAQDNKLHHYNLSLRTDRVLPIPTTSEMVNRMPMFLELDGDFLVFEQGEWTGYDLVQDTTFSIPAISPRQNPGKWTSSTHPLISGGRLVWQTSIDKEVRVYTTQIVRDQ